jgi:hypothetical protein
MTRAQLLTKAGEDLDFPQLGVNHQLAEWLLHLGPVSSGMAGAVPMPHSEIAAWAKNNGIELQGNEAEWLYKMSGAYASELAVCSGKDRVQPYSP